ncbi:hypothetical protein HPB48_019650 [Haemaphysalis longicornis]|uniref:Short-chain dehydrogenase n=1 Tax=Haemaphysalis longicornis TaxID=44386 RepID=A0A9J6G281_HAELO|nr:hypothetical protein HPB48_019650 [Haemaphysalis longicornis]
MNESIGSRCLALVRALHSLFSRILHTRSPGIGKEAAKELAKRGARVILACRNVDKGQRAAKEIDAEVGRSVTVKRLDLCSFESVRQFADDVLRTEERLDVLVNNAGIFPELLKKSAPSRVINLSSCLHHLGSVHRLEEQARGTHPWLTPTLAYCNSKMAMLSFTTQIAQKLKPYRIGKETAKELCRRNARVILACRNVDKARLAAAEIAEATGVHPVVMQLDLCSLKSVRHFAQQINEREQRLDVLINNAGLLPPPERTQTEDGFEMTFQANHLGHFLLTSLLLDILKKSAPSRIINVGSVAHWFGIFEEDNIGFKRYKQNHIYSNTKMYNMLFTVELARRLVGTGVTANCCHPGFVRSHLADRTGDFHARLVDFLVQNFGKSVEDGAQTSVHLAVAEEVEGISGKLFADCKPSSPPSWASNPKRADILWKASENMIGLR